MVSLSFWSTSHARANALDACGGVYLTGEASCEFQPTKECMTECVTVAVETSCVARIYASCEGNCTATASASCTSSCTEVCMGDCTAEETPNCMGLCESDCNQTCNDQDAKGHGRACCAHSCSAKCDERCGDEAPPKECEPTCTTACTGSCTAQANTQCQVDCQTDTYVQCEQEMVEKCKTDCKTTGGAIFCDGQFLAADDIKDCADQLASAIDIHVDVQVKAAGTVSTGSTNGSAGSDGGDDKGLKCSVLTPGAHHTGDGSSWAGVSLMLGLAGVFRRRNWR